METMGIVGQNKMLTYESIPEIAIEGDFMETEVVNLDHAGSTFPSKTQMKYVYEEVLSKPLCNPHSRGPSGLKTARMIEDARELVLSHFHTTSDEYEVIFTSGATASLKLLGECFPWSTSSTFCYGYHSHTSLLGMRAYAPIAYCLPSKYMNNFAQSLSTSSSSMIAEGVNDNAKDSHKTTTYHLMAVPGECNFTGVKYPLSHIGSISNTLSKQLLNENAILTKNSSDSSDTHNDDSNDIWLWCLDASKLAATSHIDLSSLSHDVKPDYIVFSFYKIFGYPTGLGALLIKKCKYVHDTITTATTATAISVSTNNMTKDEEYINLQQQSDIKNTSMRIICLPSQILNKKYHGGGSVTGIAADVNFTESRGMNFSATMEDGTVNFYGIAAIKYGFEAINRVGGMKCIQEYTHKLISYLYKNMVNMSHVREDSSNNVIYQPLCEIYGRHAENSMELQGSIIAFNLLDMHGQYIGYSEVSQIADIENIQLRTGCFCNIGTCQEIFELTYEDILFNIQHGRTCQNDSADIINNKPTGAIRISVGYMSTKSDCDKFLNMLHKYFLNYSTSTSTTKDLCFNKSKNKHCEETSHKLNCEVNVDNNNNDSSNSNNLFIDSIYVYPIKSCAGMSVSTWPLSRTGLLYDREFAVVNAVTGTTLTLKSHPRLCYCHPLLDLTTNTLTLRTVDDSIEPISININITVDANNNNNNCNSDSYDNIKNIRVCIHNKNVIIISSQANEWFSNFLSIKCLLVRHIGNNTNQDTAKSGDKISLSNQGQFLLLTKSSVVNLQNILNKQSECHQIQREYIHNSNIDTCVNNNSLVIASECSANETRDSLENMEKQFRPNLVINSSHDSNNMLEPHLEDSWDYIEFTAHNIESATIRDIDESGRSQSCSELSGTVIRLCTTMSCSRCNMININTTTGKLDQHILRTIALYRRNQNHINFGQYLDYDHNTQIHINSIIDINELPCIRKHMSINVKYK